MGYSRFYHIKSYGPVQTDKAGPFLFAYLFEWVIKSGGYISEMLPVT